MDCMDLKVFGFFFFEQCFIRHSKWRLDRRGKPTILRHVIVKRWRHTRRQQIDPRLRAFSTYKWITGSGAYSTPRTETAGLWPHPFRTQPAYKEIWVLKTEHNTKLQATKLHSRTGPPVGPQPPNGKGSVVVRNLGGWRKEGRGGAPWKRFSL